MESHNDSDSSFELEENINLDHIDPLVDEEIFKGELLISDYLLVSGTVSNYFDDFVTFKVDQSDKIYEVSYNEVRHIPPACDDYEFKIGEEVETYMYDYAEDVFGWAKCVLKSIEDTKYIIQLDETDEGLVSTTKDKVRPITTTKVLETRFLFRFEIELPNNLLPYANDMNMHESFRKAIGNPLMRYDPLKNALIVASCHGDCESIAKMLQKTHFKNVLQRMLLTENIDNLVDKFQKIKSLNFTEEFELDPELLKYVIGQQGNNIRKVENMDGVLFVSVDKTTSTVKIVAETLEALKTARHMLNLKKDSIQVPNRVISNVIGKNGKMLQEIADECELRHIKILNSDNSSHDYVELEFIGTESNVNHAKILVRYQIAHFEEMQDLFRVNRNATQQYNTTFVDLSSKSTSASTQDGFPRSGRAIRGIDRVTETFDTNTLEASKVDLHLEMQGVACNQDNDNLLRGRGHGRAEGRSRREEPVKIRESNRGRARGRIQTSPRTEISDRDNIFNSESGNVDIRPETDFEAKREQAKTQLSFSLAGGEFSNQFSSTASKNIQRRNSPNKSGDSTVAFPYSEEEIERQRKQGAIKRVPISKHLPIPQQKKINQPSTSQQHGSDNSTYWDTHWSGRRWRNRNYSSRDSHNNDSGNKVFHNTQSKPKRKEPLYKTEDLDEDYNESSDEDLNDF